MVNGTRTASSPRMAFEVDTHGQSGVVICRGRMIDGNGLERLTDAVRDQLYARPAVVLDLCAVVQLDARGVGTLASLVADAKGMNGRLHLVGANDRVRKLLRLAGLDIVFDGIGSAPARLACAGM